MWTRTDRVVSPGIPWSASAEICIIVYVGVCSVEGVVVSLGGGWTGVIKVGGA
jgi:hypothetical protein